MEKPLAHGDLPLTYLKEEFGVNANLECFMKLKAGETEKGLGKICVGYLFFLACQYIPTANAAAAAPRPATAKIFFVLCNQFHHKQRQRRNHINICCFTHEHELQSLSVWSGKEILILCASY